MMGILLLVLVIEVPVVAYVLFRGLANINRQLGNTARANSTPRLSLSPDWEETVAIMNLGSGTAVDIVWCQVPSGRDGRLSHLRPNQCTHIRVPLEVGSILNVSYRSTLGEGFSRAFERSELGNISEKIILEKIG